MATLRQTFARIARRSIFFASISALGFTASHEATATDDVSPCLQCHAGCEDFQRAGNPQCVARYARPSNSCADTGYYVGGGAAFRGHARCVGEGTWGWDYTGRLFDRRVWLGWWHGERYQGGPGKYKTDGPRLYPTLH